jgi:predicted GNAT family acetyltransferase
VSAEQVIHKPDQCSFVADCDGAQALLTYRMLDNHTVDFNHTYVPKSARGTGIAAKLVNTASAWAHQNGYTIKASCWYAHKILSLD